MLSVISTQAEEFRIDFGESKMPGGNWNVIPNADRNNTVTGLVEFTTGLVTPVEYSGNGWMMTQEGGWVFPDAGWVASNAAVDTFIGLAYSTNIISGLMEDSYRVELISTYFSAIAGVGGITVQGQAADSNVLGTAATSARWNPYVDAYTNENWLVWNGVAPSNGSILISYTGTTFTVGSAVRIVSEAPPVYYVDASGGNDTNNGASWATAKKTIQAAVDLAGDGVTVLVTNGVYDAGGAVTPGYALTNRVVITNAITVQSVNGPEVTIIEGASDGGGTGPAAIRGVYMSGGATLVGFTVTNGYTMATADANNGYGGGVWMATNCVASNLVVLGNVANQEGGGVCLNYGGSLNNSILSQNTAANRGGAVTMVRGGSLNNCLLYGNSSVLGGGAAFYQGGTLNNCTVSDNSASSGGGGAFFNGGGTLNNCIVYGNTGGVTPDIYNLSGGTIRYTCGSQGVTNGVDGCITSDPLFVDAGNSNFQLQESSPCINTGDNAYAPTNVTPYDLAGNPRILDGTVDMGAYEFVSYYVDASRPDDSGDGLSWATAKRTIQAGVDIAEAGKTVWVTNGVYDSNGAVAPGSSLTNRVCITKALTVRSVNGPSVTSITGSGPSGAAAVRGVFMTNSCSLVGFTITNGFTATSGGVFTDQSGGGIWLATNCVVSNCVIIGNEADFAGGGISMPVGGTLNDCTIEANSTQYGGGIYSDDGGTASGCTVADNIASGSGGGLYADSGFDLNNSIIRGNQAGTGGGYYANYGCLINNCLFYDNTASANGGGIELGSATCYLKNCTVVKNSADNGGGLNINSGYLRNCIVWSNTATSSGNDISGGGNKEYVYASDGVVDGVANNSTNDPMLRDLAGDDFTLLSMSPCVNTGDNASTPTNVTPYDLAGNTRIMFDTVDIGAYEVQYVLSSSSGPYAGGNTITITNGTLGNGSDITNVTVGGVTATITGQDVNWVTITLPAASSAGTVDIVVQSFSLGDKTFANTYTYNPVGQIGGMTYDWTQWQEVAGLPTTVYYTHGAVLNGAYYIVGGTVNESINTNVFRFDGTSWTEVAGIPAARRFSAVATYSNAIYCIAGDNDNSDETNTVFKFDGTSWTTVAPLPVNRYSFCAKTYDGYMYAIAGNPLPRTNVFRYNGTVWEEVAGTPSNQVNAAATVAGGYLYSAGGYLVENVFQFDGTNWADIGAMPDVVNFGSGGTLNDQPYIYGGYDASLARTTNVFRYDGTNWEQIIGFPEARYGFAGGEYNGSIYVVGGYDNVAKTNVYRYPGQTSTFGVAPITGSWTGGYQVVISGANLCNGTLGDVTNVTICGVDATVDSVDGSTQIVVTATATVSPGASDVVVYSTSYGMTTKSNAFTYTGAGIAASGASFGHVVLNSVVTNIFTVTNSGNEALIITAATNSGTGAANYNVSALPMTVDAGTASNVPVVFTAGAIGDLNATCYLANNSPVPSYTFGLTGSVYAATTNVGPYAGGNSITITNGSFGTITNVLLGASSVGSVIPTAHGPNWFTITLPAATNAGTVDIIVQTSDNGDTTLANAYTYNPSGSIGKETFGAGVWTNMGAGFIGTNVQGLAMMNGELYAAGNIHHSDTTLVNNIARWDGANWNALGVGTEDQIFEITAFGNTLYAGGEFTNAGGMAANRIAAWDGSTWTNLGDGLTGICNGMDTDAAGNLYVNGGFATGIPSNRVGRWDGSAWHDMGWGFNNVGDVLLVTPDDSIYVGGGFTNYNNNAPFNVSMRYIAQWNGDNWTNMSFGMNQRVYALASSADSSTIYAGGVFSSAGGVAIPYVASWNGTTFTNLGAGVNNRVYAMATDDQDNLYVGGRMTTAGSVSDVGYVAKWDGTSWTNLGQGLGDYVAALHWSPQYGLVAGGEFTNTGSGVAAGYIAQFNNTAVIEGGITPDSGSYTGGYTVVISGTNLCDGTLGDVTNVTLVGVSVASIDAVYGSTQIVVTAGVGAGALGDVVVYSASYGATTSSNAFTYTGPGIEVLGTNGTVITSGAAASTANGTDFGNVMSGGILTNTFAITNTGNAVLNIGACTTSGAGAAYFELQHLPAQVEIGGISNIAVVFSVPALGGDYAASLLISNEVNVFTLNVVGSVFGMSTNNGPYTGGNSITITNGTLGNGSDITNVTVGGVVATITGQGTSWVTITLPAASTAGAKDILVQSTSEGETLLTNAYTYNPAGSIGGTTYDWTQWEILAGLPQGLNKNGAGALNGKLYSLGGYQGSVVSNVYEFSDGSWTEVAGLPATLHSMGVALFNGAIYSVGGYNGSSAVTNVYTFNGTSWTEVAGLPAAKYELGAGVMGGTLYAYGGRSSGGAETNVYAYDGTNWTEVIGMGPGKFNMGYAAYDGKLYSVGGYTLTSATYEFDGASWQSVSNYPLAAYGLGLAPLNDKLYGFGGNDSFTGPFTNAFAYDGNGWFPAPGIDIGYDEVASCSNNGSIYAVGGYRSGSYLTNVYRYPAQTTSTGISPTSGSWTGGYQVVITGSNLGNGSDITNVTLAGVTVASIDSQSATQVIVTASSSPAASGDVVVHSISYGTTIKSNAFTYLEAIMSVLGTNAAVIESGQAASSDNGTDFGSLIVGTGSLTNTFSITNSGNTALNISGVTTSGAGATSFTLAGWPVTVAVGAVEDFTVIFEPDGGGIKSAALNIANNSTGTPYVINLAGYGSGGGIALSTNWLGFTATYGDGITSGQVIRIENVGVSSFSYSNTVTYGSIYSNWFFMSSFAGTVPAPGTAYVTNGIGLWDLNAGTYSCTVTVSAADATNSPQSYSVTLDVNKADQTITFPHPGAQETTNLVGLAATATSGLPVSFNVGSGPGTISGGTNLSFTGAGDVVLTASQAGNSNWNAAASITHTIVVSKAVAPVTINNLSQVYDGTARSVTASTTPGGLTVNFTYEGNTWAPTNAGSYAVTGVVNDIIYQGWQTGTLVVAKADQTITFPAIASQTYTSEVGLVASATSGFGVSFAVGSGPATISGSTNLSFTATGAVSIVAAQAGDANWNAAPSVTNSFMVNKADQVITFPVIADQETTNVTPISATALSTLGVTFSVVSGPAMLTNPASPTSLTYTNDGTVLIAAHQTGSNYWNAAPSVTNSFNVIKAIGSVTLSNLTQVYTSSPLSPTRQTSPTGLTVNLTFDGSTNLPVNAGSYTVIGTMDDPIYQSASTDTFTIVQATQTIAFAQIPDMIITDAFGLSATGGDSTNPVTFAVLSGPASIAGGTNLSFNNVGEVRITADQAGDSNYLAAITVTNVFNVSPTTPEISSPTASNILAQTATLGGTINSTNGAPVTERGVTWWTDRSTNIYSASESGAFGTGVYSLNVTGIVAGITNFFQAYAVNVSGTTYSTTSDFLARPDAPELTVPTNIQAISFYANWNAAEGAVTYYIDVSETNSFDTYVPGYQNLDIGSELSVNVTGLGSSVWYYYRVRAENDQGLSTNSATRTVGLMMDLVIDAAPAQHDSPAPLGYGTNQVIVETMVTNSVTTPADESNGVRYACTGWTGTGDVPAAGLTNTVSFLFTTDSTLTWNWKTQYLITQESTGGYVYGLASGWKDEGWIFDLTPRPNNGYIFAHWLTNGSYAGDSAVFRVLADAPKEISAIFASSVWDINATGTTSRTDWQVVGPNGFGTFEICNPSDSGMLFMDKFLYANMPDANMHIRYPDGTSPAGEEYVDVTTEVQTKLQSVGNLDQIMDPGECITLDPIEFLGKNPAYLDDAFYSKGTPDMYDVDTDGDTIPNYWEEQEGLNPNNPNDGGEDQDDDDVPSDEEYIADTNPYDAASYLHISAIDKASGSQQVEWIGGTAVVQYLEWNAAMDMDVWLVISTNYPPTPITNLFDDTYQDVEGYYRIRAVR